jgi:CHAD domain-containing protein
MPGESLLRHWDQEMRLFHQNLELLKQQPNENAVHDLRVAVKKLRSYYKLARYIAGVNDDGALKKTEELFSILGKKRNIDISRQLALKFLKSDAVIAESFLLHLHLLHEQLARYSEISVQEFDSTGLDNLRAAIKAKLDGYSDQAIAGRVSQAIQTSLKETRSNLKNFDEEYHLARKQLKDVLYWCKAFPGLVLSTVQVKMVDRILTVIGNAQDHQVLISNLKIFRKTMLAKKTGEYEESRKAEHKVGLKKEFLIARAHLLTTELIKRAEKQQKRPASL